MREEGIESSYAGTQNLNVSLHGQPVLCVTPSSEIYILPAGSKNEEVNDLYHRVGATADEVYEYVEAVQSSPLLRASDLKEEFRLLADFGCAVLAGRERENDRGYQFVTWVWDFDRRGVSHGHYFEGNYHAAKEDFAVRSGLISRAQIFSADQLAELYRATDFFLEEGPEPEDKQKLDTLILELNTGQPLYTEVSDYCGRDYLVDHMPEDMDLTELNLLAEKLASLEPVQEAALEGLVRMDLDKGMTELPLCRLIDLANSADCCHVAPGIGNDEQLGHFYVDNDFPVIPPGLPKELYEILDYEVIGRKARMEEGGVFTSAGYVVQHSDLDVSYSQSLCDPQMEVMNT